MKNYELSSDEERSYLEMTLSFIRSSLVKQEEALINRRSKVIASRKQMWEDSMHSSEDFDRIPEMAHYLDEVNRETDNFVVINERINMYKKLLYAPYFGRFDYLEDGSEDRERIYIGLRNLMDLESSSIIVYDWRAPISSIFYQNELGRAEYKCPSGNVSGEVLLKRQYKIEKSELKYYFDSSVTINDEMLQEVLIRNSSSKMKNIVETIQKEQDLIIRDSENDLMIVQGTAGSGKTSIALHRIAYLLYIGMNSKLYANNIIIISPNNIFSNYISNVLPELGEENVQQTTFDNIAASMLDNKYKIEVREEQLEALIKGQRIKAAVDFKGSEIFVKILDRYLKYYEKYLIKFEDIYYNGEIIEKRQELHNYFLNDKVGLPITKRLKRMENMILNKIQPLRKIRVKKIEQLVQRLDGHELEIKPFSRLLSIKRSKVLMNRLHKVTEVNCLDIYKSLFKSVQLLKTLSEGFELPENIEDIMQKTIENLNNGYIAYEDCAPLLYIKLKIEGNESFSGIRQVVVDEAQDYNILQYEVFKILFKSAGYTILGDINQTIEKTVDNSFYNKIDEILKKKKSVKLFLNKSYRSSYEISRFIQKILKSNQEVSAFERYEGEPVIVEMPDEEQINRAVLKNIKEYFREGYESAAVICKTQEEACKVYETLRENLNIKLIDKNTEEIQKGAVIIPSYLSKGLEFDAVIIYNGSAEIYSNEYDRHLLYIAASRALHKLDVYYSGSRSEFLSL